MIYVFDRDEVLVTTLSNEDKKACPYTKAVLTEELNGPITFEFEVPAEHEDSQLIKEDYMVAVKDKEGEWQAFYIKELEHVHDESLFLSAFCEHIITELKDSIIENIAIDRKDVHTALTTLLAGTRWSVGTAEGTSVHDITGDFVPRLEALNTIIKRWEVEARYRIQITGQKITDRIIDLFIQRGADTGKRFEFNKDMTEIRRTVDTSNLKTALFLLGKEKEDGTRTTVEGINNGLKYVEDTEARDKYGFSTGAGTKVHRFGVLEVDSLDPAEILAEGQKALEGIKDPLVQYEAKVIDIARIADVAHEAVHLGATSTAIDRDLDLALRARVIKQVYDLLEPEETDVTLGQFLPVYAETIERIENNLNNINFDVEIPDDVLREGDQVRTEWLEGEINALKNKILAGDGTVQITENDGILIENAEKTEAIRLLGGILAIASERDPVTGLYDWRTFGTGEGFTADLITTGKMSFDRAVGGSIQIGAVPTGEYDANGEPTFVDGVLSLWSSDPSEGEIARLSGDYKGFNFLRIDELSDTQNIDFKTFNKTPNLDTTSGNIYYYVDPNNGDDENNGTIDEPKRTVQNIIDNLPKILYHHVYIYFLPTYLADSEINIEGFRGRGVIYIRVWPLNVRYVRDWINGSNANPSNHWYEVNFVLKTGSRQHASGTTYPDRIITNSDRTENKGRVSDGGNTSGYYDGGSGFIYVDIYFNGSWNNVDYVQVWHYYPDGRSYFNTKTEVSEDRQRWFTIFDSAREGRYNETADGRKSYVSKGYLKGQVKVRNNSIDVEVYDLFIDANGTGDYAGYGIHTEYLKFQDCVFFGDPNVHYCVYANGGNVRVLYSEINTAKTAGAISAYGGHLELFNVKGSGFPYGHYAHGTGVLGGGGTGLLGSTANTHIAYGGQLGGSWTHQSGEFSPITIVERTKTWTNSSSDTWAENYGAWRTTDDDVLQGKWESYGLYRGCWFFGTDMRNTVVGKNIKKVRVYVTRANESGYSTGVPIHLMPHGYSSKPGYAPSLFTSNVQPVTLSRGQGAWVDCTGDFAQLLKDGKMYGVGCYVSSTSASYYARMLTTCKVEITYEDVT